jgi:hypothetical protein
MNFGARIAEEEASELANYFVETDQWQRMYRGGIDVVYGPKGSGKSAIYALLLSREGPLFDRGILLAGAEDPRGAPVFGQLVADPPTSEAEFRALWKLYFLSLIGRQLREYKVTGSPADRVVQELEDARLLEGEFSLRRLLRSALDYVRAAARAESVEGGVKFDPMTGIPAGLTGKITLREPTSEDRKKGLVSVDEIFELADQALGGAGLELWLLLDRLDVAFAESEELEANALRALFRVYIDLQKLQHASVKIFLRSDIWRRITQEGFREGSHITRTTTISWNAESLLNLVIRRLLRNDLIRSQYKVTEADALANVENQRRLFYRIFPRQVDQGPNKPTTFDWMMSRTRDGSGATAPRELIHLLNAAREAQLRRLETGLGEPPGEALFDPAALREALPEVSQTRLEQTLYAEYPKHRKWIQQLKGERTQQTPGTLASIWQVGEDEALSRANQLVEIGFFEQRGTKAEPAYWVPFLYRGALSLVQGTAEEAD